MLKRESFEFNALLITVFIAGGQETSKRRSLEVEIFLPCPKSLGYRHSSFSHAATVQITTPKCVAMESTRTQSVLISVRTRPLSFSSRILSCKGICTTNDEIQEIAI